MTRGFFRIGVLGPLLVGLFAAADFASRWVPINVLAFRAWESMITDIAPTGPFGANRYARNYWAHGDLATMANAPELREYRDEAFTTDAYGYRNPPELADGKIPIKALLLGDSFGSGSGSTDDEILSAQLGRLLGGPVYNLSGGDLAKLADIRVAAKRLNFKEGVLIYQVCPATNVPPLHPPEVATFKDIPPAQAPPLADRVKARYENLKISRLEILVARWKKRLLAIGKDPQKFESTGQVIITPMTNGKPILFLRHDVAAAATDRSHNPEYFFALARELEKDHIKLVVAMVPTKYAVYAQHLEKKEFAPPNRAGFTRLKTALEAGGIPAVDLTDAMLAASAEAFPRGEYLYWLDDTHWNPRGIRVAANEIHKLLVEKGLVRAKQ